MMMTKTSTPINNNKTWQELVKASFGGGGEGQYKNYMRRSLQAVVLYEAHRCCKDSLPALLPFQRKVALLDMAKALVGTTLGDDDMFLTPEQQTQLLWRTNSSQEVVNENNCWNRRKMILQELESINRDMKEIMKAGGITQEEALKEYLQKKYDEASSGAADDKNKKTYPSGTTPPPSFFYNHNHVLPCYALYYLNGVPKKEGEFPAPCPPKDLLVTPKKPAHMMLKNKKKWGAAAGCAATKNQTATSAREKEEEEETVVEEFNEEGWNLVGGETPAAGALATKKKKGGGLPKIGKRLGKAKVKKVFYLQRLKAGGMKNTIQV